MKKKKKKKILIMMMIVGAWRHSQNTIFKKTSNNDNVKMVGHFCARFQPYELLLNKLDSTNEVTDEILT